MEQQGLYQQAGALRLQRLLFFRGCRGVHFERDIHFYSTFLIKNVFLCRFGKVSLIFGRDATACLLRL
jgi:hypothetical protein